MHTHPRHPASWWAQFQETPDLLDAASITEALADAIVPRIESPLLRKEAEIAADVVVRHLNKTASQELAERASTAISRLNATVHRIQERTTADDPAVAEASALCHALEGRWAEAASQVEPHVGTTPLIRAFLAALARNRIDTTLTMRLLQAGQTPAMAVQHGLTLGNYAWWPNWLLKVVTDRALAGTLDQETITALDQCAYADLSPAQARVARKLLAGDQTLIDTAAERLEAFGDPAAAAALREGDIVAVALAARLIPL